jgi:hypothetical protein
VSAGAKTDDPWLPSTRRNQIPFKPVLTFGRFLGNEQPLFPEIGAKNLRIFTGVEQDLLESLIHAPQAGVIQAELPRRPRRRVPDHLPANMSVSATGSCMVIEGL